MRPSVVRRKVAVIRSRHLEGVAGGEDEYGGSTDYTDTSSQTDYSQYSELGPNNELDTAYREQQQQAEPQQTQDYSQPTQDYSQYSELGPNNELDTAYRDQQQQTQQQDYSQYNELGPNNELDTAYRAQQSPQQDYSQYSELGPNNELDTAYRAQQSPQQDWSQYSELGPNNELDTAFREQQGQQQQPQDWSQFSELGPNNELDAAFRAQHQQDPSASPFGVGLPSAASGPRGLVDDPSRGVGTVWDAIRPTGENIPNTLVPRSFEMTTPNGDYWVHPNATKHMGEYLNYPGAGHGQPLNNQAMLSSFQSAVSTAGERGINLGERMQVNDWELQFNQRPGDRLPVINHARPMTEGGVPEAPTVAPTEAPSFGRALVGGSALGIAAYEATNLALPYAQEGVNALERAGYTGTAAAIRETGNVANDFLTGAAPVAYGVSHGLQYLGVPERYANWGGIVADTAVRISPAGIVYNPLSIATGVANAGIGAAQRNGGGGTVDPAPELGMPLYAFGA